MDKKTFALTAGNFGISALCVFISTYLPLYISSNTGGGHAVFAIVSAGFLIGAVCQPFSGRLSDRIRNAGYSRKPLVFIFSTITSLCIEIIPRVHFKYGCIFVFFLFVSFHMYQVPLAALIPDNTKKNERDEMSSIWGMAGMAGSLFTPVIAAACWKGKQVIMFDIMSSAVLFTAFVPLVMHHEEKNGLCAVSHDFKSLKLMPLNRRLEEFYFLKTCWWIACGLIIPFFPYYMNDIFGISVSSVSITIELSLVFAVLVSAALARHICGCGKRMILSFSMAYVIFYSMVLMFFKNIYISLMVMVLYGEVAAVLAAVPLSILYEIMPSGREGELLGYDNIFYNLPQAISIGAAGAVYAAAGIRAVYSISVIFSVITIILLVRFRYESIGQPYGG